MSAAVLKRVVRRETHSPRTVAAVVVLVVVILAVSYAGIELVLHLLGKESLLIAPGVALEWLTKVPSELPQAGVIAVSVALVVVGLGLVWLAFSPGRRPRHELEVPSHAVVVDNGVIASSLAERIRREFDLSKGAVVTGIGHRSADITVRPEPGQTVDSDQVRGAADSELDSYGLAHRLKIRTRVLRPAEVDGA